MITIKNVKTAVRVYTGNTNKTTCATFNEAVRIARRRQAYGFNTHITIDHYNSITFLGGEKVLDATFTNERRWYFDSDGHVRLGDGTTHLHRNLNLYDSIKNTGRHY